MAALQREVQALRAERAALARDAAPMPAAPPVPGPPASRPPPRRPPAPGVLRTWAARVGLGPIPADGADLEALVGRYGTVALAGLLILMGLGAFLTWAIAEVSLTPTARVGLGALGAGVLAVAGWRLRGGLAGAGTGGTRRFGDVLLALALAAVHVDAWGAGPALGLVPPAVALLIAAVASGALAWLAWRERDQALFVVGVGGALVAPFVTGVDVGSRETLAVYGWLVLSAGALALPRTPRADPAGARPPRWVLAARVLGLGGAAYAAALLRDATAAAAVGNPAGIALPAWQLRRDLPALFALACAAVPLLAPGRVRRAGVALLHLTTAFGVLLTLGLSIVDGAPTLAGYALVATLGAQCAAWRLVPPAGVAGRDARRNATVGALALPLALLVPALVALHDPLSLAGAATAGVWAASSALWAVAAARDRASPLLGMHVAAAGLASMLVPLLGAGDREILPMLVLAAHAAGFALLLPIVRQRPAAIPSLASLGMAAAGAAGLLRARPAYDYVPFLGLPSLTAAATVAAAAVLAWRLRRDGGAPFGAGERTALTALPAVAAFLWGREELARAGSPEVATFLLVGYFAAAGVAALAVGRARRVAGARQVGLALAIYAALKALAQASELQAVGLRIGSYLLVGAFLLAVGYWYRSAGDRPEPAGEAAAG